VDAAVAADDEGVRVLQPLSRGPGRLLGESDRHRHRQENANNTNPFHSQSPSGLSSFWSAAIHRRTPKTHRLRTKARTSASSVSVSLPCTWWRWRVNTPSRVAARLSWKYGPPWPTPRSDGGLKCVVPTSSTRPTLYAFADV